MASAEASSSRRTVQEPTATPEELTALTSLLSDYYAKQPTKINVTNLYLETKQSQATAQKALEASLLSQAPSFLKLHKEISVSKSLLGELESFLNVFYNDLSSLSLQMKTLQGKSNHLGKRLRNRRQLEDKVRVLVSAMVLDPQYVDMIFTEEASMGKVSLDVWKECAEKLSACIRACEALEETFRDDLRSSVMDIKALQEARELVEGCRIMAVTKIRPILISTFSPLRSSLSTNMPILQSILLKSYRPLYSFLSHHAPRVAIDVQRSYVAAARLYFETGFRRYERSLAKARDRERPKAGSYAAEVPSPMSFVEPVKSAGGIGSLLPSASAGSAAASDPWMADVDHLDNCKVTDGPAVTLAYLADDSTYKAPVEALFRSLSLTFLDNSTSEYCFLARFFEGVDVQGGVANGVGGSTIASSVDSSSAVKVKKEDAIDADYEDGPLPEESASVQGHDEEGDDAGEEEGAAGTVVGLSEIEKRRLRGRGAIDGLWKQVMEPVMGTYNTFVTSILATQPSLLSLYTMLKLNDNILATVQDRGASSILQGTFMTFKLKAWPLLQKQFDDVLESVKKVKAEGAGGSASLLGSFGGLFAGSAASSAAAKEAHDHIIRLICARYARLYSSIARLNNIGEEDLSIFASLLRLRGEIESMLAKAEAGSITACHEVVLASLETGPASVSQARMQSEISHWREAKRSRSGV